jgi:hypothetical protein
MNHPLVAAALAGVLAAFPACAPTSEPADAPSSSGAPTLTTFGSDEAFVRDQQRMVREWEARVRTRPPYSSYPRTPKPPTLGQPVPRGEPVEAEAPGVHEPGIVKATRDYLVILRRNRLHTVRIAGGALDTVASVDAYAPGSPDHERSVSGILVSGDVVAAVAPRGVAVQVVLFRLDAAGGLAYQGTYLVRTDGGEERMPSVRMVDGRLVILAPIGVWAGDPRGIAPYLPAVLRVAPGGDTTWTPLTNPGRVYRPAGPMRADDGNTFHALTVCGLASGAPDCRATVVYAPRNVAQHVSATAAYVWTLQWRGHDDESDVPDRSMLYRIPLDGGAPTALGVSGQPGGQHAMEETAAGELHVLLAEGRLPVDRAPAEWNSVVLLRAPLSWFGDGSRSVGDDAYRAFPNPGSTTLHSRFVGDWIVYGTETGTGAYGSWEEGRAFAVRRDGAAAPLPIPVQGWLIGIDATDEGALVATSADWIRYQPLRLGAQAQLGEPFTRPAQHAWEAEAHAIFSQPSGHGPELLGVARSGFVFTPSVLFLRHDGAGLRAIGELGTTVPAGTECTHCGGYYEFARPVFLRGRMLAIVGGEVVEGAMEGERIREVRRVRIGPPALSP